MSERRAGLLGAAAVLALSAVAALAGFAVSLVRRRPPTSYATSLRQPAPESLPSAHGRHDDLLLRSDPPPPVARTGR